MQRLARRIAGWGLLGVALWALGSQVDAVWARDNTLIFELPGRALATLEIELEDAQGDVIRQAIIRPPAEPVAALPYAVSVPRGLYRIRLAYRMARLGEVDKNQGGVWTTVGVVHQIRLEGGTRRFVPPTEVQ